MHIQILVSSDLGVRQLQSLIPIGRWQYTLCPEFRYPYFTTKFLPDLRQPIPHTCSISRVPTLPHVPRFPQFLSCTFPCTSITSRETSSAQKEFETQEKTIDYSPCTQSSCGPCIPSCTWWFHIVKTSASDGARCRRARRREVPIVPWFTVPRRTILCTNNC